MLPVNSGVYIYIFAIFLPVTGIPISLWRLCCWDCPWDPEESLPWETVGPSWSRSGSQRRQEVCRRARCFQSHQGFGWLCWPIVRATPSWATTSTESVVTSLPHKLWRILMWCPKWNCFVFTAPMFRRRGSVAKVAIENWGLRGKSES